LRHDVCFIRSSCTMADQMHLVRMCFKNSLKHRFEWPCTKQKNCTRQQQTDARRHHVLLCCYDCNGALASYTNQKLPMRSKPEACTHIKSLNNFNWFPQRPAGTILRCWWWRCNRLYTQNFGWVETFLLVFNILISQHFL